MKKIIAVVCLGTSLLFSNSFKEVESYDEYFKVNKTDSFKKSGNNRLTIDRDIVTISLKDGDYKFSIKKISFLKANPRKDAFEVYIDGYRFFISEYQYYELEKLLKGIR